MAIIPDIVCINKVKPRGVTIISQSTDNSSVSDHISKKIWQNKVYTKNRGVNLNLSVKPTSK